MKNEKWKVKNGVRWVVVWVLLIVLPASLILSGAAPRPKSKTLYKEGPRLSSSDRMLIIAPHPDDESLGCGGLIRRAAEKKIPTMVVLMTNGDGYKRAVEIYLKVVDPRAEQYRELGTIRHLESTRAMEELGLEAEDVVFLSYPDGGSNSLWDVNWDYDNLHTALNGGDHSPYPFAFEKNAPYCGANVVKNMSEIIESFKPTVIVYPNPGDDNHDHWAVSAFVEYVLAKTNYQVEQRTYLVHKGFDWPVPWLYRPDADLLPPSEFLGLDQAWLRLSLSKAEENRKYRAVKRYVSQIDVMEPFLEAFVRRNDLFSDYSDLKARRVTKKPNFFSGSTLPYTLFKDPGKDTFAKELEGFADLTSVGFALGKERAWLALDTRRRIASDIAYVFHLRIFSKDGVRRVDIKVHRGKATSEMLAKDSVSVGTPIPMEVKDSRLYVEIPGNLFRDADRFLLGVDDLDSNGRRLDRTAYRRIDF